MVRIAIAGSSGGLAREVTDGLIASKKHQLLLLSTKGRPEELSEPSKPGVSWEKTDYQSAEQLAEILLGVHTVLCFFNVHTDPEGKSQKNLIDASVLAGVKRFAPSEWATSSFEHMSWYDGKSGIREYLRQVNAKKKVLEYSLFQPGFFMDYWTVPYMKVKHIHPSRHHIDLENRRAIVLQGGEDDRISFTSIEDLVNIVIRAVEYEGEWPVNGGLHGDELSVTEIITLGEKIRGGPFAIERVQADDLKAGIVKTSWVPLIDHPALSKDQIDAVSKSMTAGLLLAYSSGATQVSDDWNKIFPDYMFTSAEELWSEAWNGKP